MEVVLEVDSFKGFINANRGLELKVEIELSVLMFQIGVEKAVHYFGSDSVLTEIKLSEIEEYLWTLGYKIKRSNND